MRDSADSTDASARDASKQISTLTGTWIIVIAAAVLTAAGIYRYEKQASIAKQNAHRMVQKMLDSNSDPPVTNLD